MSDNGHQAPVCCSFCGKPDDVVDKMIAGPDNLFICDNCVRICAEMVGLNAGFINASNETREDLEAEIAEGLQKTPKELKAYLA